jgi:hypothetical protein
MKAFNVKTLMTIYQYKQKASFLNNCLKNRIVCFKIVRFLKLEVNAAREKLNMSNQWSHVSPDDRQLNSCIEGWLTSVFPMCRSFYEINRQLL